MILPKLHFEFERWKFNKEFGIYVSSLGNIKSKDKEIKIKELVTTDGYKTIRIIGNGKMRFVSIHRLVMKTFKPLSDYTNMTVDHIDSNKRNNKLKNLEWVSEEENQRRAQEKLLIVNNSNSNKKSKKSKPTAKEIEKAKKKKAKNKKSTEKVIQGPFYIYDTYGNKYKDCVEAAIKTLKTNGFQTDEKVIQQTATKIGECISHQDKYFGVFWYRRNEKGEMKPIKK